jgi:PAS domain S-box-containing protein
VVRDLSQQKVAQTQLRQNKAGLVRAREEAGKELRKSDERFRLLIESSIQGVFIHRDFKPLFVNRFFAYTLGYTSPEDFISKVESFEMLMHPEERERLTGYAERRKKNLPAPDIIETRLLHKNGSTLWVQLIARMIDWEGLPAIQGTMIDITDRKLAEEKLKTSESIMAKAQQVAHLGSLEWDIISNRQYWSDEVYRIMGLEPQSVEPNEIQFSNSLHPDDQKEVLLAMTSSAATGEPFSMECRVIRPDGEERIVHGQGEILKDEHGKHLKMIGTVQDITERKQAEYAVRNSEQRFRDFAESSADWLWEMDENLRFTYLSSNVERIVGVPPQWHYGKTREELLGDDYDCKAWEKHFQDLQERKPFRDFSYLRVGKGVESRWTSTSGKPIFSEDGTFLGYRGTGRDISEWMRVQEELREKEERFRNLVEASIQGILVHRGGKALFVNQSFAETFGYESPEEIMALESMNNVVASEDREKLIAYYKARLKGEEAPRQYTFRGVKKDRSRIWLEANGRLAPRRFRLSMWISPNG